MTESITYTTGGHSEYLTQFAEWIANHNLLSQATQPETTTLTLDRSSLNLIEGIYTPQIIEIRNWIKELQKRKKGIEKHHQSFKDQDRSRISALLQIFDSAVQIEFTTLTPREDFINMFLNTLSGDNVDTWRGMYLRIKSKQERDTLQISLRMKIWKEFLERKKEEKLELVGIRDTVLAIALQNNQMRIAYTEGDIYKREFNEWKAVLGDRCQKQCFPFIAADYHLLARIEGEISEIKTRFGAKPIDQDHIGNTRRSKIGYRVLTYPHTSSIMRDFIEGTSFMKKAIELLHLLNV